MPFVAKRIMKIKRGDSYVMIQPGEAIPEAASWPNLQAYIKSNWVANEGAERVPHIDPAPVKRTEKEKTKVVDSDSPQGQLMALSKAELSELAEKQGLRDVHLLNTKAKLVDALMALLEAESK